jgi:hypothetical protein
MVSRGDQAGVLSSITVHPMSAKRREWAQLMATQRREQAQLMEVVNKLWMGALLL